MTLARQDTFVLSRVSLRQILLAVGMSDRNITTFMNSLEKTHRHSNIIVFANLLERMGIDRDRMTNVFRRMGMDDITINNAFRMVDESKIRAETGHLYDAEIVLS